MLVWNRQKLVVLLIVWTLSAVYVLRFVDRGWIPQDDGALAEMAERVLDGQLPHRDFDEIYTGGLSLLYAAAFKLLGINLLSIRVVLLVFFLAFVPAFYSIALRLASPFVAGAVTLLGVVWSVPNYFAGLPSWYNLFFATFGILALIRHIETGQRKWLFVAGVWGGISILVKIVGVFYIVAAFLFLTYREEILSALEGRRQTRRLSVFLVFKILVYVLLIGCLVILLQSRLGPMEIFHFLLPAVWICGTLLWSEWREAHEDSSTRTRRVFELLVPFGCGAAIPIMLFLIPYFLTNSLGELYQGLFVLPQRRLQEAAIDFPPFPTVIASVPYALFLSRGVSPGHIPILDKVLSVILILIAALALSLSDHFYVYQVIWQSARSLAVVAVLIGCLTIARSFRSDLMSPGNRQVLLLLVVMTGWMSLVQFPFPDPIYLCYIAPVVVLALLGVVSLQHNAPRRAHFCILVFYFVFALLWMNTGYVIDSDYRLILGARYAAYQPESRLDPDRGGIRVHDAELYNRMVRLARAHRGEGYIYAAPDCPEIYFLSGLRNPTRKIFDFLGSQDEKPRDFFAQLEAKGIKFVVVNQNPQHSSRLRPKIIARLGKQYPKSLNLGRFNVRWTE